MDSAVQADAIFQHKTRLRCMYGPKENDSSPKQ